MHTSYHNPYLAHNRESLAKFEEMHGKSWWEAISDKTKIDYSALGADNNAFKLWVCNGCGDSITPYAIITYYEGDVLSAKCKTCKFTEDHEVCGVGDLRDTALHALTA